MLDGGDLVLNGGNIVLDGGDLVLDGGETLLNRRKPVFICSDSAPESI